MNKFKDKETYLKVKENLKTLAKEIRALKASRKDGKENGRPLWQIQNDIDREKDIFRHRHIAYCLLRGTPMEKIERPAEGNEPDLTTIDKYMEEWKANEEATEPTVEPALIRAS